MRSELARPKRKWLRGPLPVAISETCPQSRKIVQTPDLIVIIYKAN
jgi:hypothetical protein